MCDTCTELAELIILEELTNELIFAEKADRLAPRVATRALFDHEHTAQVYFADLEDNLDNAVGEVTRIVETTHTNLLTKLLALIFGTRSTVTAGEALDELAAMIAETPEQIRKLLDEAATELRDALQAVFAVSAGTAYQEYVRQGGGKGLPVLELGPRAGLLATPPVSRSWTWITQKTQEHLAQPAVALGGPLTKESLIEELVEKIKPAGAVDQARQSVHVATGLARNETGKDLEASEVYASELLDGATCRACAAVDGKKYENLEEATNEYAFGYYGACRGSARCRGSLLFLYDVEG